MVDNVGLAAIGLACLFITLGGIRAYSISSKLEPKSKRVVLHEEWVSRKTNKSHNPRKSKTRKYLDSF